MKNKKSTDVQNASVLAFERKLSNSDAILSAGNWVNRKNADAWKFISITQKDIKGTISNRLKKTELNDPAKLNAKIENANLQSVDIAALPFDADTLKVSFTLRVLGDLSAPTACNSPTYQASLIEKIGEYAQEYRFKDLALRYAENLANGRFLWRNRIGAQAIEIQITHLDKKWTFNAYDFSLKSFTTTPNNNLIEVAKVIQSGLLENSSPFLKIDAFVQLGSAQEVYPSQELVLEKNKKSRFLYQINGAAAMHSQKIGNALRTIDTWYNGASEFGPIAIEPYGSVTSRGTAYRHPKEKCDFYTLIDGWILQGNQISHEDQHYVIANLIRGGVFGESGKKED